MIPPTAQNDPGPRLSDRSLPSRQEFMKLLLAQVTHQDPLKPMDNAELMQQISGLETMARLEDLSHSLEALGRQQALSAGSLLGRRVEMDSDDGTVTGVVESVRWSDGEPALVVSGRPFPLDALRAVLA